jgi:hypothetical protein
MGSMAAASSLFAPPPADALIIKVNGKKYDIITFNGTFEASLGVFAPPSSQGLGRMPWWDDGDLAEDFANALGDALVNNFIPDQGPFFAFTADGGFVTSSVLALNTPGSSSDGFTEFSEEMTYAVINATRPVSSVPAPLPIFGAAACFGWSRRLRTRITK